MREYKIPVRYKGEIVGWTNDEKASTVEFVSEEARKLIEDELRQPLAISSRSVGKLDEDGFVEITRCVEHVILNQNKDE
tara:strand:+ start:497 stop:733 length:237 start_codon:yes stop_codon:yes gene_type:complete